MISGEVIFPLQMTFNGETLAESLGLQQSKQVCLTTDNGSNLVRAAHLLKWLHVPCFGHNLHLAITNAIKDDSLSRAIGVTRKQITSFTHSWKKKELTKDQTDLGIPHHITNNRLPSKVEASLNRKLYQKFLNRKKLGSYKTWNGTGTEWNQSGQRRFF